MATVERRQRRKGDGTLGEVRYRVRWRDPDGTARSRSFNRRRQADAFATEVEHRALTGSYIDHRAGRVTLREYAEGWRRIQAWAPSTAARVEATLHRHIYPVFGGRPLAAIRRSEVQAWVAGLELSASTVGATAPILSAILRAAVADRLIAASPYDRIVLPRVERHEIRPPTVGQVEQLADVVGPRWRAAVLVGAGLGLRASECLGLTVDAVDFLRREVAVVRQTARIGGTVELVERVKTPASRRTVPLPDVVGEALSAHLAAFGRGPHGIVFHRAGGLVEHRTLADVVQRSRARAGLPAGLRFHDLRHFYASALIESGVSVKTIQARLGHASAVETLDTYGHLWPDSEEKTRAAIDGLLGPSAARVWPAAST